MHFNHLHYFQTEILKINAKKANFTYDTYVGYSSYMDEFTEGSYECIYSLSHDGKKLEGEFSFNKTFQVIRDGMF